jgi:hypothetical protein
MRINIYFQIDKERNEAIKHLSQEYLNLLAIVFGDHILTGQTPLRNYWHMTMADLEAELCIRTKVNKARADKLTELTHKKQVEEEQRFMEELKNTF